MKHLLNVFHEPECFDFCCCKCHDLFKQSISSINQSSIHRSEHSSKTVYVKRELDRALDIGEASSIFFLCAGGVVIATLVLLVEKMLSPLTKLIKTMKRQGEARIQPLDLAPPKAVM